MVKAIFMDYTGTLMQEESKYAMQMASLVARHSTLHDVKEIVAIWWGIIKRYEAESYGDTYLTEDEIVGKALDELEAKYLCAVDREEFVSLAHLFWSKSPAFDDVPDFFAKCRLPVYIVTNNGTEYVNVFLRDNNLSCAGVVCGDMVKAYKPHRELFEKALEISGCRPQEVLHVGDSLRSDVSGALAVGIQACLLDRKGTARQEPGLPYTICRSLRELV